VESARAQAGAARPLERARAEGKDLSVDRAELRHADRRDHLVPLADAVADLNLGLAVGHQLSRLAREGTAALDRPLRAEILRRGAATAAPAFAAYVLAERSRAQPQTVAFAGIVSTQLGQTLDLGRLDGRLSGSVVGAVGGTTALLAVTSMVPASRGFFGLTAPSLPAIALVGGAAAAAVLLGRALPP
jgi:hypothetical protein